MGLSRSHAVLALLALTQVVAVRQNDPSALIQSEQPASGGRMDPSTMEHQTATLDLVEANREAEAARMNGMAAISAIAVSAKSLPETLSHEKITNPNTVGMMGAYEPASEEPQPVLDWPYPYAKGIPLKGLLIAVVSSPHHVRARQAFRRNWDLLKKTLPSQDLNGITWKFFIGQLDPNLPDYNNTRSNLQLEEAQHGDVVRLTGFVENYRNLTLKTMNIVTWAHVQHYGGMFKLDDDSFLRLDNFLEFLKAEMNPRMIYAGYFVSDVRVITDPPTSKWFCDRYPYDVFPDYASGPGYFIGGAVMEFLVTNQNQLVDYQIEDAAMGIWTQKMAGIDRVNLRTSAYMSYCEDGPDLIWVNPLEPEELERLTDNVIRGDMCLGFQVPQQCVKNPCLCTPKLDECMDEGGEAWSQFSTSAYDGTNDTRALLLQTEEGVGGGWRISNLAEEIRDAPYLS